MSRRTERLGSLMREEISYLLRQQIKDPRLMSFISITKVIISPDLRNARVLVSILGDEKQKKDALRGFRDSAGYFRSELFKCLGIRRVPELVFELDEAIEKGASVLKLINELSDHGPQEASEH